MILQQYESYSTTYNLVEVMNLQYICKFDHNLQFFMEQLIYRHTCTQGLVCWPIGISRGSNSWLYRPRGKEKASLGVPVNIIYRIIFHIANTASFATSCILMKNVKTTSVMPKYVTFAIPKCAYLFSRRSLVNSVNFAHLSMVLIQLQVTWKETLSKSDSLRT